MMGAVIFTTTTHHSTASFQQNRFSSSQASGRIHQTSGRSYLYFNRQKRPYFVVRILFSPLLSVTTTLMFVTLLILVTVRPSWCPSAFCASPTVSNLPGVHDENLNLYFQTFQGDSFVLPGDPTRTSVSSISSERNPTTTHAVLLKNGTPSSLYRVVLVVRSLHTGIYSIVVDQVALRIVAEPSIAQHLNVWTNPSFMQYDTSRYRIVYRGEEPTALLPAHYLQISDGYTQLATNEADQLDIQLASYVPVDLEFQLQVTYHIGPDQKRFTLQLPQLFEVVFSSQSNWHSFSVQDGHFIET